MKSMQDNYKVSQEYTVKMLQKNDYKIIPTLKAIKEDVDAREYYSLFLSFKVVFL